VGVNTSVVAYLCMYARAREKERESVCSHVFVRVRLLLALCLFGKRARPKQGSFANTIGAILLISHVRVCACTCVRACTSAMRTIVILYIRACVYARVHVHMHVCVCGWVGVCACLYVYTYTGILESIETFELVFPLPSPEPLSSPTILQNGEMSSWW